MKSQDFISFLSYPECIIHPTTFYTNMKFRVVWIPNANVLLILNYNLLSVTVINVCFGAFFDQKL